MQKSEKYWLDREYLGRAKRRRVVIDRQIWGFHYDSPYKAKPRKSWKNRYKKKHQWDISRVKDSCNGRHDYHLVKEWADKLSYETNIPIEKAIEALEEVNWYDLEYLSNWMGETDKIYSSDGEFYDGFMHKRTYDEVKDSIIEDIVVKEDKFIALTLTEDGKHHMDMLNSNVLVMNNVVIVKEWYKTAAFFSSNRRIANSYHVTMGPLQFMFCDRRPATEEESRRARNYLRIIPKLSQI